jgi:hypothetical protein
MPPLAPEHARMPLFAMMPDAMLIFIDLFIVDAVQALTYRSRPKQPARHHAAPPADAASLMPSFAMLLTRFLPPRLIVAAR